MPRHVGKKTVIPARSSGRADLMRKHRESITQSDLPDTTDKDNKKGLARMAPLP